MDIMEKLLCAWHRAELPTQGARKAQEQNSHIVLGTIINKIFFLFFSFNFFLFLFLIKEQHNHTCLFFWRDLGGYKSTSQLS